MKSRDLDERIVKLLNRRGLETKEEIDKFLNPDISMLNDPFLLKGMSEAKKRIERAIDLKEKIVVYGDYDCDGISACVILYKFFKKHGIEVDVYIPDRFDDGYGLSSSTIDEVIASSHPDLIITVDLGVTAASEVEKVKAAGIDIIVTDHHEPSETLPNCTTIDPKIEGQDYPFNGLCGAGVALKVVEAIDGRDALEEYFDVCAIATIGDIVPLVDENRLIAKRGIDLINSGKCLKSYKYMMAELGLKKISGTDVTFKFVPRINASGRMSKGKKVFDFLIATRDEELKSLYNEIVKDNELRLEKISEGSELLEEEVKKINFQTESILLLRGDFHQGVLGILASRICHDYNRPTIVFTKTEEGTLKGSGRSLDNIDIHNALEENSDLLIRFGGHKMAVGVELEEENFEKLRAALIKSVNKQSNMRGLMFSEDYDIEVTEDDISEKFINQLSSLEPFGCKNERPTLMLKASALKVNQMKDASYRHFKITTPGGKSMVAFSAEKHIDALKSPIKKNLIIELENNEFRGKVYPQAVLKNVYIKEVLLKEDKEREIIVSLIDRFLSENNRSKNITWFMPSELQQILNQISGNCFGSIVVVDNKKEAARIKNILPKLRGWTISHTPLKNRQNTILISSRGLIDLNDALGYNNIVFLRQIFLHEKEAFCSIAKVYCQKAAGSVELNLDKSREANIYSYMLVKKYAGLKANNVFEWLDKIKLLEKGFSKAQFIFSCLAFIELGFIKINFLDFSVEVEKNPPKRELSSSKFMNKL